MPLTSITEAVYARALSGHRALRIAAHQQIPGPAVSSRKAGKSDIDAIRDALYASKIIAYAQGFEQMEAASQQFGWSLKLGEISIAVARRLHHSRPLPQAHPRSL